MPVVASPVATRQTGRPSRSAELSPWPRGGLLVGWLLVLILLSTAIAAPASAAHRYDGSANEYDGALATMTAASPDVREFGRYSLLVLRDPGHTSGSVAYRCATNTGGARFVAGSDGVVTDLVGGSPNAVVLGKYPAYVNEGAATGARTFSMSDDAWNAMTPAQQWTRNQQFLDQAISRGSEIRLAMPPTASNLTGWYAREIEYLSKQGYTISSDGARMIPPGG